MDKVENVLNKILGIVESIADAHASIKTFMVITETKMPDTRDVEEIRTSIGRSEHSLVTQLTQLNNLINELHALLDLRQDIDAIRDISQTLSRLCPENCTKLEEACNGLMDLALDIQSTRTDVLDNKDKLIKSTVILEKIREWTFKKIPAITVIIIAILMGVSYFATFMKLTDWVVAYSGTQDKAVVEAIDKKYSGMPEQLEKISEKLGLTKE